VDSSQPETLPAETRLQVWKSNDLIRGTVYEMPTAEMKLLFSAISRIKRDGETFSPVSLTVGELSELMGLERRAAYSDIKGMAESLASRTVHLFDHASRHHKWLNWCDVSYVEGSGRVMILFRDVLKPYLLQLKEKFVQYGLDNVLRLNSSYHIRLYEYLKSWEFAARPHRVKLADLRKFIGAESRAYEAYFTFNGSILKPAHEAIERFTDLRYAYRPIKAARAVVEVEFDIFPAVDPELPLGDRESAAPAAEEGGPEASPDETVPGTPDDPDASTPAAPETALEAPPASFSGPAMPRQRKTVSNARRAAQELIAYWNAKMTHSPVADAGAGRIDSLTRRLRRDAVLSSRWREMIDAVAKSEVWNGRGPKGREGAPFHASFNWFLLHRDEVLDAAEAQRTAAERRRKPRSAAAKAGNAGGQESLFAEPVSDEERRELAAQLRGLRERMKDEG
jgi:hypothetical protein